MKFKIGLNRNLIMNIKIKNVTIDDHDKNNLDILLENCAKYRSPDSLFSLDQASFMANTRSMVKMQV